MKRRTCKCFLTMLIKVLHLRLKAVMTRQHTFLLKCSFCKQSYDETTQACKNIMRSSKQRQQSGCCFKNTYVILYLMFTHNHLSHVTCHMSCVMCHFSNVLFFLTKLWSYLVEGLLPTGPTPSSFFCHVFISFHKHS